MRPDPKDQRSAAESGRVIYLGEVRKRRAAPRRQAPDRHYLVALAAIAVIAWAAWATIAVSLPPAHLLTYAAFMAPLCFAVGATGTLVAYAFERWRGHNPGLLSSTRRGFELALILLSALALLAAHLWSLPIAAVSILAVAAAEAWYSHREV